jgi:hypothetical protein
MKGRQVLRPCAAGLCGLALALLPQTTSHAGAYSGPAAGATAAYSFAPSSLGGGGFENVIAADPRHNGVVISGGDVAGLQRSTDFGKTWLPAQHGSINSGYHPVAAIAFDPKSPNDVYAATNGGVAESTDDGVSWSPLPSLPAGTGFNGSNTSNPSGTPSPERCVGRLLTIDDTTTPHPIYAASFNQGVWKYTGGLWTNVVTQAQLGSAFCLTSLAWGSGGTLDVATWGAGVFAINNLGGVATVHTVAGAPVVVQELVGLANGDVWGAAYTSGVGFITSGVWMTRLAPAGSERYMSIDGYAGSGGDVVIAGSDNSQLVSGQLHAVLHETTNSGATWTSLPTSTAQVSDELLGPQTGNPWWHASYTPALLYSQTMVPSSIVIEHERSGDDLWVAGYGGNWRRLAAEGQATFYPSDAGLGSTVNHQIALDPSSAGHPRASQRVYLGDTDWGMFSSADGFSTQQGIADDQFGVVGYDTVVDSAVSPPVVYLGVGNRDSNTQGDLISATAPAVSSTAFQSLGLAAATGGGRPLALGVVDTSGTPTLIVAVEASGIWTRVGAGPWTSDTSLFATDQQPTAAIATGTGAQASTVYAYDRTKGVYRSLDAGAPGSWTLIWKHASLAPAAVPFLMVDSVDPTRLWVSAVGGLYRLDGAASTTMFGAVTPIVPGVTSGLGEVAGQVFTTELVPGTGLELQVSDATGANFTDESDYELSGTLVSASSIAVASDGTVYIATAGSGLIVGTPVEATTTSLTSTPNPSRLGGRVTFTATVTAGGGGTVPAGIVGFWNGTQELGTANLNASGVATFSSSKLKKGSHSIVAKYQGGTFDTPSSSAPIVQTVN